MVQFSNGIRKSSCDCSIWHSLTSFLSVECITNSSGFLLFLASTVNDVRTKLHIVEKHSTVEKRAKRMPDATVETTGTLFVRFLWSIFSQYYKWVIISTNVLVLPWRGCLQLHNELIRSQIGPLFRAPRIFKVFS